MISTAINQQSNLDRLEAYNQGYRDGYKLAQRGVFYTPANPDDAVTSAPAYREGAEDGRKDGFRALFNSL